MKKSLFVLLTFVSLIGFFSCTSNKENTEDVNVDPEYVDDRISDVMQRTVTDTVSVLSHVRVYLDYLQQNKIDSALTFLYVAYGDSVLPLSGSRLEAQRQQLLAFPVLDYTIEKMQMFDSHDTRVHYTIKYFEKPEDSPLQNTLQCVMTLRRVGYMWYLLVPDETRERIEDAI